MARSRVGGTRGLMSGKIANEVFTIRRDSAGNFVQIVSTLPEGVERTLTPELAKQRLCMSVVERAMGAMNKIVQHSFEGYTRPEEAVAAWASVNIKKIQEDITSRWDGKSEFSYPVKEVAGFCPGAFQVSQGTLDFHIRATVTWNGTLTALPHFQMGDFDHVPTFGEFLEYADMQRGDYYTWVFSFTGKNGYPDSVQYMRMTVGSNFSEKDRIDHTSIIRLFNIDSTMPYYIDVLYYEDYNMWTICVWLYTTQTDNLGYLTHAANIRSHYDKGIWRRNTATMYGLTDVLEYREKWNIKNPSEVWDTWYQEQ